ncbi:hypothetical protein [Hymenobacter cellulosivorans]|uniref:Lipocalin-like domain-containing protein n=1 Tax=Hymenobacter cellulosivorans TaxID=2932249 RepID=A0ABY4FDT8_9BACT|nr:hypothetical protein [Hymenobacter cellulosivorans]UOQ54849.1 hypothetical protein MUN80_08835 [Hymenobacter cellulosivorans]
MKTLRHILLLSLLLTAFACKKDKEAEPSKTDLLTAKTWQDQTQSLRLNTSEGTRSTPAADMNTYQFTRDGKVTITAADKTSTSGTWAFVNNESQLAITSGGTTNTFALFEVSATKFSFGVSYNQAQIQQGLGSNGGAEGQFLKLLLLTAGNFTFSSGTPTITPAQLTAVDWKNNAVPR